MGKPQFQFRKFFACDVLTPQGVYGRNFVRGGICTLTKRVAMATTLLTVDCKLFQMMPYIIILKVRKFLLHTARRFSTARKNPVRRHNPPSLDRVKCRCECVASKRFLTQPYRFSNLNCEIWRAHSMSNVLDIFLTRSTDSEIGRHKDFVPKTIAKFRC